MTTNRFKMEKPLHHSPYTEYAVPKTKYGIPDAADQFRDNKFECEGRDAEDDSTRGWEARQKNIPPIIKRGNSYSLEDERTKMVIEIRTEEVLGLSANRARKRNPSDIEGVKTKHRYQSLNQSTDLSLSHPSPNHCRICTIALALASLYSLFRHTTKFNFGRKYSTKGRTGWKVVKTRLGKKEAAHNN